MDRTRISRRASELTVNGKRYMGQFRTRWFSQVLKDMKMRRKER
jgi:hypothetical protein